MVCLRNICINTLHKGDKDDDDDNNNNNNNNNVIISYFLFFKLPRMENSHVLHIKKYIKI